MSIQNIRKSENIFGLAGSRSEHGVDTSLIQQSCVYEYTGIASSFDGNISLCRQYLSDDSHTLIVALISNPNNI